MNYRKLAGGLAIALLSVVATAGAEQPTTGPLAIRWLGDPDAETEPASKTITVSYESLTAAKPNAPVTKPAEQLSAPPITSQPKAVTSPVTPAAIASIPPAIPLPAPPVEPAEQKVQTVQATIPATPVAAKPAAPATAETVTGVASKPASKQRRMTNTAGGRWTIPTNSSRKNGLTAIIADPFGERNPPGWNPLYRAGSPQPTTRLIGDEQLNSRVVPVNYDRGATADVAEYRTSSACANGSCTTGSCTTGACSTGGCTTGACCAPACNPCCGPTWSFGVDSIFLSRSSPDSDTTLIECNCAPHLPEYRRFAPKDFDLDVVAAPRFRLYRHAGGGCGGGCNSGCGCNTGCGCNSGCGCGGCGAGIGFEMAYFNLDSYSDYRQFYGDLSVVGFNFGPDTFASTYFDSQLQSLEANIVRNHGCWTKLITGFRWIQLDENASVFAENATDIFLQDINTTNNLYGGHFGFRRLLYDYGGCLTLDSTVKAGVFGNDVDRHSVATGTGAQLLKDGGVSFVGDVEFQANFEITCRCTLTAGYQLLWITGLASAPEQFVAFDYINRGETIFLHGANVGFVYTW